MAFERSFILDLVQNRQLFVVVIVVVNVNVCMLYTFFTAFTSETLFNACTSVATVSKAGLTLCVRMLSTTRETGARILRKKHSSNWSLKWLLTLCPHVYFVFRRIANVFVHTSLERVHTGPNIHDLNKEILIKWSNIRYYTSLPRYKNWH